MSQDVHAGVLEAAKARVVVSVDCYGWVEVNDPRKHALGASRIPKWGAVVRIDDIVDRDYDAYGFFFNVYHHSDSAIASRRGLPLHISESVEAETEDPTSILTAVTWIPWSEVLGSNWQASFTLTPGWNSTLLNDGTPCNTLRS